MIWPFPDGTPVDRDTPRARNGVLVALSSAVVIVQAAYRSGSLNAATWALRLERRLFVVPGPPWDPRFQGCVTAILRGGAPLWTFEPLFAGLGLSSSVIGPGPKRDNLPRPSNYPRRRARVVRYEEPPLGGVERASWTEDENIVFSYTSPAPEAVETIVVRTGLPASAAVTALLTLSLKDVVVEGPDGFFRRRIAL